MNLDLSKFKQGFVRDTNEDMAEIQAMRLNKRIGEGSHEVEIIRIHEKDGQKLKTDGKLGGSVGFSVVLHNAEKAEQILYISVPLSVTYKQASLDKECGFQFRNSAQNLMAMGINPGHLREAIIESNGAAVDLLVGAQFTLINSWPDKKLHLEYEPTEKAYYFVDSAGQRFPNNNELGLPIVLSQELKGNERYAEAAALAREHGYQLATQMNSKVTPHSTADNAQISLALEKAAHPAKRQGGFVPTTTKMVNNTTNPFPNIVKKPTFPRASEDN